MQNIEEIIDTVLRTIGDRGKEYDQNGRERSMPDIVDAFNSLTGHNLTYEQGWIFMQLLKIKRSQTIDPSAPIHDSHIDGIAFACLGAEQRLINTKILGEK